MTIVVKIGGQAQETAIQRKNVARQIAALRRAGHRVVVIHGGGKALTETLGRLGITTEFHQGLRVTDAATRDVAVMVLAGIVNKQWVAEIQHHGQPALGICGGDARLVAAKKIRASTKTGAKDLGFVGRPHSVNTGVLEMALEAGWVPVVASVALNGTREYYNINADDLAAAIASALKADRLFYLTDSGGVWDSQKQLLATVRKSEIPALIRRGVVRDGMIPKLRSCARTLKQGVAEIDILSPALPNALLNALKRGSAAGTRVVNK